MRLYRSMGVLFDDFSKILAIGRFYVAWQFAVEHVQNDDTGWQTYILTIFQTAINIHNIYSLPIFFISTCDCVCHTCTQWLDTGLINYLILLQCCCNIVKTISCVVIPVYYQLLCGSLYRSRHLLTLAVVISECQLGQ